MTELGCLNSPQIQHLTSWRNESLRRIQPSDNSSVTAADDCLTLVLELAVPLQRVAYHGARGFCYVRFKLEISRPSPSPATMGSPQCNTSTFHGIQLPNTTSSTRHRLICDSTNIPSQPQAETQCERERTVRNRLLISSLSTQQLNAVETSYRNTMQSSHSCALLRIIRMPGTIIQQTNIRRSGPLQAPHPQNCQPTDSKLSTTGATDSSR